MKTTTLLLLTLVSFNTVVAQSDASKKAAELRESRRPLVVFRVIKLCATHPELAEELELSSEQSRELKELCIKYDRLAQERVKAREKGVSFLEAQLEVLRSADEPIRKVLAPRQNQRLDQLANQYDFASMGGGGKLGTSTIWVYAFQLIGDSPEWPGIAEKMKEMHSEYWTERQKLWDEKMDEILDVLSPENREKYLDLVGEIPPPHQQN